MHTSDLELRRWREIKKWISQKKVLSDIVFEKKGEIEPDTQWKTVHGDYGETREF